jgi:thioredoxin reductase (NADPH)
MVYDVIIIGAGPCGLSAAIAAQRVGRSTLVIDKFGYGGNIVNARTVENYPGIESVSGVEFAKKLFAQATGFGAGYKSAEVTGITLDKYEKVVETNRGEFRGKSVIIASGSSNKHLDIGEDAFLGSGVSYSATYDGGSFKRKRVAVIGGGDTATTDAEFLADICDKVYVIVRRDHFKTESVSAKHLETLSNVEIRFNTEITDIHGKTMVNGITVKNNETGESEDIEVEGVVVAIGQVPENKPFMSVAPVDVQGYFTAGEDCESGTPGVFVAGDCRAKRVRQLSTAMADGSTAALQASTYLSRLDERA